MADRHVLDTHALVWYLEGNPRLGARAKAVMDDPASDLVLPLIALAEAGYVVEHGRSAISDVASLLADVQSDARIEIRSLDMEILQRSFSLTVIPEMHDRLIVATGLQLQAEGHTVKLLTKDATILSSGAIAVTW